MTQDSPDRATLEASVSGSRRLDWGEVRLLYVRELRTALREKSIVVNSILIPVFLYPFLLWLALTGVMFLVGQTEGFVSRIAVKNWPTAHPGLRIKLERDEHLQIVEPAPDERLEALRTKLERGQLDAILEFLPARNGVALPENFQARITYSQAKERSDSARKRLDNIVSEYRAQWLKRAARERGLDAAAWQGFTISSKNLASERQMGAFLLGLIAPVIFVVMVASGCFYAAVDSLAGERERNTWETLMSTGASRLSIVTAKYLYVATLGGMAGLLNLGAVALTLGPIFKPLLSQTGKVMECAVPLGGLPLAVLGAVLLAGFVAAAMMLFAVFARTFKEGQAMITPLFMLLMLPIVFLQAPGLKFTVALAFIPVVNVTLMVREALSGQFLPLQVVITVAVSAALIVACLRLAVFILRFEEVMVGSGGNLLQFLRTRALNRRRASPGYLTGKS